jgi:TctA family transporter
LVISDGSFSIFITRPISAILMVIVTFLLFAQLLPALRKKRGKLAQVMEED